MGFSVDQIPDMSGKVAIVTGANTGIGRVTAVELARKGAQVILACRSLDRTQEALQEIQSQCPNGKGEFMQLDLTSLKSVKEFAKAFRAKNLPLHLLVNNAGIMAVPSLELTTDGFEMQFGTNHVGHYYLTRLLLDVLEKSAPARIINVSSLAHTRATQDNYVLERIDDPKYYNAWTNYSISKVSNIFFSNALQRKLDQKGVKNVWVNSVHPGVVRTELLRQMNMVIQWLATPITYLFFLSPLQGALTSLYVATSPDIVEKNYRAEYFVPLGKLAKATEFARNEKKADELWDYTEKAIKEKLGDDAFSI